MKMKQAGKYRQLAGSVLLLSMLQCSTYFNTFYNAETSFNDGYKLHEKVMENYPDSLLVAPPPEARAKYDRAIEKSLKVLDVFPHDKKWHDDAVFLLGKSYLYEKETGKAIRWLKQLQQEYQQSPFIPESYLYLAKAYIADDNLPKAEETLKFALDRYPFLDKDHKISLLLIEIEIRHEGKSRAIGLLEQVRSTVKSGRLQIDLLLRVAELYQGMEQYDKAIALLKKAPRDRKDALQEYRIDHNLVSCYIAVDSLKKAAQLLKTMQANKQYVPYIKEILYVNGIILARLGNVDEAIAVFKQVIGTVDTAVLKADTSKIISKAWFELGQLYQKRKGNYKEAQKYYKLVAERTVQDSSVTSLAAARMKAINQIVDLRKRIAARDTGLKRTACHYKIGEQFFYELDEPDSACCEFSCLTRDSVIDSTFFPKALFAAGRIEREQLNDTARSDSLYRLVIARFPGTAYSRRAQEELRLSTVAKTRKEESIEAFRDAEKIYFFDNDPKAAVQAYYNVYKKYPDMDIGPKSLYAAAWITDNELQKKKIAKSLYEKICERYPESGYCKNEAKPRIKVVLDTLEALRRENKDGGASLFEPKKPDSTLPRTDSLSGGVVRADSTRSMRDTVNGLPPGTSVSVPPPAPGIDSMRYYRGGRGVPPDDMARKSPADSSKPGAQPSVSAPLQSADSSAAQRGIQTSSASPPPIPVLVDTAAMRAGKGKYHQPDTVIK
jgi:TolA-binding protein